MCVCIDLKLFEIQNIFLTVMYAPHRNMTYNKLCRCYCSVVLYDHRMCCTYIDTFLRTKTVSCIVIVLLCDSPYIIQYLYKVREDEL